MELLEYNAIKDTDMEWIETVNCYDFVVVTETHGSIDGVIFVN